MTLPPKASRNRKVAAPRRTPQQLDDVDVGSVGVAEPRDRVGRLAQNGRSPARRAASPSMTPSPVATRPADDGQHAVGLAADPQRRRRGRGRGRSGGSGRGRRRRPGC